MLAVPGNDDELIAKCDPESEAIRAFLEFWGVVFGEENPDSLAFNQDPGLHLAVNGHSTT